MAPGAQCKSLHLCGDLRTKPGVWDDLRETSVTLQHGNHANLHPAITCRDLAGDGRRMEYTKSGRVKPLVLLPCECVVSASGPTQANSETRQYTKQECTLTRGDEERELRWQEHVAGVFGGQVRDLNRVREEHESFAAVTYGSQAVSHHEAVSDPVLAQVMAPPAVEGVVATLQKAKGCWPRWGEQRNSPGRRECGCCETGQDTRASSLGPAGLSVGQGDGYTIFTSIKGIQLSVATHVGCS